MRSWERKDVTLPDGRVVNAVCPVIISASRATDIPAFFARWMRNRIRAGYLRWTNPFNAKQVDFVSFTDTRAIVFWTKNPKPMMPYLDEVDASGINYYFQVTLNDYEAEGLEPVVPPLASRIETFMALSKRVGPKRAVWRYDPLILTDSLTVDVLLDRMHAIAAQLHGYTEKLVISFADIAMYRKVRQNLANTGVEYREFTPPLMREFAAKLQRLSKEWGVKIGTCSEGIDLAEYGIAHNRCIDDNLLIELFPDDKPLMSFLGYEPDLFASPSRPNLKDKGQRKECGCIMSKDIGVYDTCRYLCTYCYATSSQKAVETNLARHDDEADSLVTPPERLAASDVQGRTQVIPVTGSRT